MARLYINGADITDDVLNLDEYEIEVGLNTTTKTVTRSVSSTIRVTGNTYDYLAATFFRSCNNQDKILKAAFQTDICGGITVPMDITVEGMIDYPDIEEMDIVMKSVTDEDRAYDKLNSTYWFENDFEKAYEIPIVYYADQPNWIQWAVILLTFVIRVFLRQIDLAFEVLCKRLTLGGFFGLISCKLNITGRVFAPIDTWLTGLGRWGTAPLIREILNYQCTIAGLNFSSSILNDPDSIRYNLALFSLERGKRGSDDDKTTQKRQELLIENAPLYTVIELLDILKDVFEADFRIIKGTLYFERKDFFDKLISHKLITVADVCSEDPPGYEYNLNEMVAYGEFQYQKDIYDAEGNQMSRWYSEKLEWNNPYSPAQKGKLSRTVGFAPARFMFDPESFTKNGFFDWERKIDEFRDGPDTFFENLFWSNTGIIRQRDLILSGNSTSIPKLLCLEKNLNRNDAFTIRKPYKVFGTKQYWHYNYPMYFQEDFDGSELTKEFSWISDPRLRRDKLRMTDFEIDCDCETISRAISDFQTVYLQTHHGKGIPEKIIIQFKKAEVKVRFTGVRVLCN